MGHAAGEAAKDSQCHMFSFLSLSNEDAQVGWVIKISSHLDLAKAKAT